MKQRFIEWELEQDPDILARFNTGKLIDAGALRHVICNVDPPEGVSFEDTMKVLNEVAEAVQLIPSKRGCIDGDAAIVCVLHAEDLTEDMAKGISSEPKGDYIRGWRGACHHIKDCLTALQTGRRP